MNCEFDQCVDRRGLGNMKREITPDVIRDAGIEAFCAAEMDFRTAPCVRRALHTLADRGIFGFTTISPEYRERICWWMQNARGWTIQPEWIVPTLGTIFSVATAIRLTTQPGEGIITQTPVYYRYEQAARRLGRKTVHCPLLCDGSTFRMDFDALEAAMAEPANKLFVLCNPHNPTGNVWGKADLERIAALSRRYGVYVFSDEIFADDAFDGRTVSPYAAAGEGLPLAMISTSLGKSFNYTGVNHADLIIPDAELRERFAAQRDADHFGSVGPFEYASVVAAYTPEGLAWARAARDYMEENARIVRAAFADALAPNYVYPMEGAYVAFIDWRGIALRGDALHEFLETQAQLVLEPGAHYGAGYEGFSRISLGSTHEQTRTALARAAAAIARHPEITKNA